MNAGPALKTTPLEIAPEVPADTFARWKFWAAAGFYLLLCLLVQWRTHAAAAAFGTYPDEPAHYIGGLLVRDYAASGLSQSPLAFSQTYHDSIPYFAIGYWPPLFYCVEAAWILLFGPGRLAVLLLSALFASGSAALILSVVRREAGWLAGFCGGVLFLALPEVQRQVCTVMVDLPVTLGVLAATLFGARYLASGRWQDSVAFSILAAAACLTKFSAAYVCVVPLLGIIVLRRWPLLRSSVFWMQPAIIAALVSPWLFFTGPLFLQLLRLDFVRERYSAVVRIESFLKALAHSMPWPVWLLVGIGLSAWIFRPSRDITAVTFFLHFAVLLVFLISSSVLNELRYFTPGVAALLIASLSGWNRFSIRLPRYVPVVALIGCTAITVALGARVDEHLRRNEMRSVVDRVLAEPRWQHTSIVVADDVEGPMIAEFAMRDPHRPGYRLIRPGKILAADDWFGGNYKSLCRTPEDVQAVLANLSVRVVILRSPPRHPKPHEILLREAVASRPELWRPAGISGAAAGAFEIFETLPLQGDSKSSEASAPRLGLEGGSESRAR
jgi:hypothetical protein